MIKNILSEQFKDLITDETLSTIEEAFNQAVEEKSKEKIQLESEAVKQRLDETYSAKLEQVVEKIDTDHTAKLKKLVEAIDTDHAVKLQKLVKGIDKKHTEMLQQIVEKHRLISASLASHLSAGDWIAVQRFISAANSKSEKEISYVIDFTGAVIGGTRVSAKLSPEVLRGLAGCAEVSWECPLLSGQFNLPLSHNPEQVRYFVSTPSPFGGNNVRKVSMV
jgi:hypothetical protein